MKSRTCGVLLGLGFLGCGEDDPGDEPAAEQAVEQAADEAAVATQPVTGPTGSPALGVVGTAPRCDATAFIADGATAPIRQGPADSAAVVATAAPGAFVVLAEAGTGWLRIDGVQPDASTAVTTVSGWVASAQLRIDVAPGSGTTASLHQAPAEASPVVAEVRTGGTVVGCVSDWLQVEVDGVTGWLAEEHQCVRSGTGCL